MSRFLTVLCLTLCAGLIAGCGQDASAEQTLAAEHGPLATNIVNLRSTATVAADQRQITLEHLATVATRAVQRQQSILATMNSLGLNPAGVSQITPAATYTLAVELAQATLAPNLLEQGGGITRLPATPQFRTPEPSPTPLMPTATVDPNLPNFSNAVTSTGVGPDDCATQVTAQFATSAPEIYVVMTANKIPAGTTLASRWRRDGEELALFDFSPDFSIDGACVWFFADSSDFAFTPGTYQVVLEINGRQSGEPVTFTIVE
jgi:hypothetical protein